MSHSQKNVFGLCNLMSAVRMAARSKDGSPGTVNVGYFYPTGNDGEQSIDMTPVFRDGRFKGYSLSFIFCDDGKVQMQVMRGEEKCGRPADLTDDISDPNALAQDIHLKLTVEASPEKSQAFRSCEARSEKEETMDTTAQFFAENSSVFRRIFDAARSALHKHGTLDKVKSPGIVFGDEEISCEIIPVCPEGYDSDYSFVFRTSKKHGSSMQIMDERKAVRQPASIDEYIEDSAKLEQAISDQIDSFIGDKLMQKQKEPTLLDFYPDIACRIYNLADAARRVFVLLGAEDDVHITPRLDKSKDNPEGISFYASPVLKDNERTEYALCFSIDKDGSDMKIIREGNDWGIPKVIDDALVSSKEIAAFIRREIRLQVQQSDEFIQER